MAKHAMPLTRVELCLFSVVDDKFSVLLGLRESDPDRWGLPGGIVRADIDTDLEAAVKRVASENFDLSLHSIEQEVAVGGKNCDPRNPWTLSIVYRAQIRAESLEGNSKTQKLRWLPVSEAKSSGRGAVVAKAASSLRGEVECLHLPFEMLPQAFTFSEVHHMVEKILNRKVEQSRLRQQLTASSLLEAVKDIQRCGKGRPAALFRARDLS